MIDDDQQQVAAQGVRGPLKLDDVLFIAGKAQKFGPLQVVRADRIVGMDHILHAATLAKRAADAGRAKADRPEVELARYLAGKRTIREAIEHIGLDGDSETAILIALGPDRAATIEYFIDHLGLIEDDTLIVADEAHARAFGVTEAAWEATTEGRRLDLVLEAVAAVDLLRS